MPAIRNIRHWDRFEWIFSVSAFVQFLGFLSYDYTVLRVLSLTSASGLMIAQAGRRFFVGWFWAFSFAVANAVAIAHLLREKYSSSTAGLSAEETRIFHTFFEPFDVHSLEYRAIVKCGSFVSLPRGSTLTVAGLVSDKVFLLLEGQCVVLNGDGERIGVISGGTKKSFLGEIALIDESQDVATATVRTDSEQCRFLIWSVDDLQYFLKQTKAESRVKLTNVFTSSMKEKLMAWNANFNVEKSIAFKQNAFEAVVEMLVIAKGAQNSGDDDGVIVLLSEEEQAFLNAQAKEREVNDVVVAGLMQKYHLSPLEQSIVNGL